MLYNKDESYLGTFPVHILEALAIKMNLKRWEDIPANVLKDLSQKNPNFKQ